MKNNKNLESKQRKGKHIKNIMKKMSYSQPATPPNLSRSCESLGILAGKFPMTSKLSEGGLWEC